MDQVHKATHQNIILGYIRANIIEIDFLHTVIYLQQNQYHEITRKSYCVNATGIPTAAYQVLHLLSCTGEGVPLWGVPHPCWGVPHLGYPIRPDQGWGTPPLPVGTPPQVPPQSDLVRERYPIPGGTSPSWTWLGSPPPGWTRLGYPLLWTERQTRVKT